MRALLSASLPAIPSMTTSPPREAASTPATDDPLAEFDAWIHRARQIQRPIEGYPEDAASASTNPLERLRAATKREIEKIGARRSVSARGRSMKTRTSESPQHQTNAEAVVGREVLKLLEQRDLSGAARSDATRLLAASIDQPDRDTLQRVLEILVTGESSQ